MTVTGVVIVFAGAFIGPGILRNSRSQPCPSGALLILAQDQNFVVAQKTSTACCSAAVAPVHDWAGQECMYVPP